MSTFEGFPKVTFDFLEGIAAHNDKAWFEKHRADYDAGYVEPAKLFVEAIGPHLRKISKTIGYEAKVNGSLFRIHRDVRFSKDKSPYKTHLDMWFWEGDRRGWDSPGYFFRMFHDRLMLGAGMHGLEKEPLARYRAAVLDAKKGAALEKAIAEAQKAGMEIGKPDRKTVPRGLDADHPRAPLLLHESLFAHWEGKIPKEAKSAAFVPWCVERFRGASPVAKWLLANVAGPKAA